MKIPFKFLPSSWGLKGKTRDRAEAEYYLEGYELEQRLIDIEVKDPKQRLLQKLEVDFKYHHIDEYQYDLSYAELVMTGDELEIERLNIDCHHKRISEYEALHAIAKIRHKNSREDLELAQAKIEYDYEQLDKLEYEMRCADIKKEPYIGLKESTYDPNEKLNGLRFEFVWNDLWIDMLRANGYTGATDDHVVEKWFNDICRSILEEETMKNAALQPPPFNRGYVNVNKSGDGPTTYS